MRPSPVKNSLASVTKLLFLVVEIMKYANMISDKVMKETAAACLLELEQLSAINLDALKEKITESEHPGESESSAQEETAEIDIPKEKIQSVIVTIQKWKAQTHSGYQVNPRMNSKIDNIQTALKLILNGTKTELDTIDTVEKTRLMAKSSLLRLYKDANDRDSIINTLLENQICEAFTLLWTLKDEEKFSIEEESSHMARIYLNLLKTLWSSTDQSDELCKATLESGIIELFMKDLSSQKFIEKIQVDAQKSIIALCIRGYLGIFLNIVQRNELNQNCTYILRNHNVIEILQEYLKTRYYYINFYS